MLDIPDQLWPLGFQLMLVSYTHLRAPETVLDFVCRLLLEKKKGGLPMVAVNIVEMGRTTRGEAARVCLNTSVRSQT